MQKHAICFPANKTIAEKKKFLIKTTVIIAAILVLLSSCGKYTSSYKAVGFVHSNETTSAFMSFYSFDGEMVFSCSAKREGDISFTAALESGSADIYYDCFGEKTLLFSISSGDEITSRGGYFEKGPVYIIVESNGQCMNGSFTFNLENQE